MSRPVFLLHRPWVPRPLAESIQAICAGHALASHRPVRLAVRPDAPCSAAEVLERFGLEPRPGFELVVLPPGGTRSSLGFWGQVLAWRATVGRRGIFVARTPRYALRALRLGLPVVAEVHGGREPGWAKLLPYAAGALCNSPGTLRQVARIAPGLRARVAMNGARGPGPAFQGAGEGIGYVGSVRDDKDVRVLAALAEVVAEPVVVVGPDAERARAWGGRFVVEGPLDPGAVPARLARFRCLVLTLGEGPFADEETCPLKLWDYLASGRPLVVADAPTTAFLPTWIPRYRRGDALDLARAVDRALSRADRFAQRPLLRTWADRAGEVHRFLDQVAP